MLYKRNYNRNSFNEIKTEADAYWLGFLLADGYVNKKKYSLTLKLGNQDKMHLEKFKAYMKDTDENSIKHDFGGTYDHNNDVWYVNYNSKQLIENLEKYNIVGRKSTKEIPIEFKLDYFKRAYVRGLIDGDGCIRDKKFSYVGSKETCEYMKKYFGQWVNYKNGCNYVRIKQGKLYTFELVQKDRIKVLKHIYKNASVYLDRKFNKVAALKLK